MCLLLVGLAAGLTLKGMRGGMVQRGMLRSGLLNAGWMSMSLAALSSARGILLRVWMIHRLFNAHADRGKMMLAFELEEYIGKDIGFTWNDGWDYYRFNGVLESVVLDTGCDDPRYPMLVVTVGDNGPVLMWRDADVESFEVYS